MDERRRSPGRPVEADPEAIALTALRLFDERGVDAVTMSEVAEAAGVSRRTLFRWFPSKAALVWGGTIEAEDRFEVAWPAAPGGTLLDHVRVAYTASLAPLGDEPEITRLRLRLIDENPDVFAWGADVRGHMLRLLEARIADDLGLARGELRATALAAAVAGAAYAALAWWARNDDARTPADVLDDAFAALRGALE